MRPTTQAPLPRVRDIVRSLLKLPSDGEIAAPWANLEDNYFWFSKSAHSLAVIAKCRQAVKKEISIKVWVPDFFCFGSLKLLLDTGVEVVFYTVNEDLTPDINNCEILAQSHKVDIFLHTHFFGAVVPTNLSAKFSKDHGAWLVEDAAHVLRAVKGVGSFGDCILYSPHKHLPIPDGAILVVKNTGISNLGEDAIAMNFFHETTHNYIARSKDPLLPPYVWLSKRLIQMLGVRKVNNKIKFYPDDLPFPETLAPKISGLSKRLLIPLIANLDAIADHRSVNSKKWIDAMLWSSTGRLSPVVSFENPPYLAGFSGSSFDEVKDIFESLSSDGVGLPVSSWPDLPPEVVSKNHTRANDLRRTQIYLPVHQSLSTRKIDKYGVKTIKKLTQKWTTKKLSSSQWDLYWKNCPKANLLQSWQYGEGKAISEGWKPYRLLLLDHDEMPVAIVQILTKKIPFIGGIARINRGPILLKKESSERELGLLFGALNTLIREARRNRWWFLFVAPEINSSENTNNGLKALGFHRAKTQPWSSGLISLSTDEDALLMSLAGKWRNSMRKGIKLGVKVKKVDCSGTSLDTLMRSYAELQNIKGFDGISDGLLKALFQQKGILWDFSLFFAYTEDQQSEPPIGVLVSIRTGDTSTYLIGTSNDVGRPLQANAVLLWEAIVEAKRAGCSWYDIGGLNESTPKGIASFKKGLNAVPYSLTGEWFKFISPVYVNKLNFK